LPEVRASLPWHAAYLSNVLFALNGNWDPWPLAHLWSLSVEEQFYLFWPLLIVLSPGRTLIPTLIGIILAAVVFRAAIVFYLPEGPARYVLTPAAFDALGAGALLAAIEASNRLTDVLRWRLAIASVAAIAIVVVSFTLQTAMFNFVLGDFLTVVPLVAVVSWASVGATGLIKRLAENSVVRYLGRISYGIYLYHFPVLAVVFLSCEYFEIPLPPLGPIRFVIAGLATVVAAAVSWHLLEQPLNRLKARLSYTAAPAGN
jgi:peptidoglycan/LPS O-acetylase OafA/YrhL